MGVDGIVVSNHAGRQVDGAIASLDALEEIVDAVGDKTYVGYTRSESTRCGELTIISDHVRLRCSRSI
jgi:hypothetical protein